MPDPEPETDQQAVAERAAEEILRIHRESYGTGARSARGYLHEDALICFLDDVELMPSEQFLVDQGKADAVLEIRGQYQEAVATPFVAAVERATGRRVVAFVSRTHLDPSFAVEIFRLAQAEGGGAGRA